MTYGPVNGVMSELTYDCRNRLVCAGGVSYTYDAENNRIAVVVCSMKLSYKVRQIILPDYEDDINSMQEILKLNEIDFATKLKYEDIIAIAELYIKSKEEPYEIDTKSILYDTNSYVINEPVWYVDIISKKVKEKWADAYISLAITDREGRLVYVQNDHGVVIEKY